MGISDASSGGTKKVRSGLFTEDSTVQTLPLPRRAKRNVQELCYQGNGNTACNAVQHRDRHNNDQWAQDKGVNDHVSPVIIHEETLDIPTVAIDIETTGLNKWRDRITVICLYGDIAFNGKTPIPTDGL
eukprot:867963-Rhodomonas_salina.3